MARFSPSAMPVPMIARPMPAMIVLTSAKSRLIIPGTRIRSEIPWIACLSTSSAFVNASLSDVVRPMVASSRSFGIVITVSTHSRSSSSPRSACICRFLPSNLNGLVTTAMVSAPSSLARLAMTGAAPVPVPPPRPVVTKTMSAPSSASISFSVSSSAACRPTFGSAPAPSPLVSFEPICSLFGAALSFNACRSVLATMNSTPSRPAVTMRLTALLPPPPTPTTLMRAPVRAFLVQLQAQREASGSVTVGVRHSASWIFVTVRAFGPPGHLTHRNSLNNPRSRPATRPNAPAPTVRAGSPA